MSVFTLRLKEARLEAGLSQEALGVLAGIEEDSASARMNQYEKGKHEPDFSMVERIAKVLNTPACYFYTKDEQLAILIKTFHRMNTNNKTAAFNFIHTLR